MGIVLAKIKFFNLKQMRLMFIILFSFHKLTTKVKGHSRTYLFSLILVFMIKYHKLNLCYYVPGLILE